MFLHTSSQSAALSVDLAKFKNLLKSTKKIIYEKIRANATPLRLYSINTPAPLSGSQERAVPPKEAQHKD